MKPAFLDSNVVLYLLSAEADKALRAQSLLRGHPWISVQVLNEVTHLCRRKLNMSWEEIQEFLSLLRYFCKVTPLTESIHDQARELAREHGLSFHDACIVAAAISLRCRLLWSEDMLNGRQLPEGLLICNPFQA